MKLSNTRTARALIAALAALTLGLASACAVDPTEIPLPGTRIGDASYPINIEFSSVLSLNAKAKVDAGGVQVGTLDHLTLVGNTAVAVVNIFSDIKLPKNTRAELRQTTLLGDMYIALTKPDEPSSDFLNKGDTIPLKNTAPPDSIEDLLRGVSIVVNGGDFTGIADVMRSFHQVFGKNPEEVAGMQKQLSDMLSDIAAHRAALDQLLISAEGFSDAAAANARTLAELEKELSPALRSFRQLLPNVIQTYLELAGVAKTVNPLLARNMPGLSQSLLFMAPLVAAISTSDTNLSVLINRSLGLFRDSVVSYFWKDGGPRVTVNAVNVPDKTLVLGGEDPQDRADDMITTMQTMGLLPQ